MKTLPEVIRLVSANLTETNQYGCDVIYDLCVDKKINLNEYCMFKKWIRDKIDNFAFLSSYLVVKEGWDVCDAQDYNERARWYLEQADNLELIERSERSLWETIKSWFK